MKNREKGKKALLAGVVFFGAFYFFSFISRATNSSTITTKVKVGVCGNNIIEGGEECDRIALDGQTCQSLGYDVGTLSCSVGCDFDVSNCENLGPDEGSVVFSGKAYSNSLIKVLRDGQIAAITASDLDGDFEVTLSSLVIGSYNFAVYAYDSNNNKSKTLAFRREIGKNKTEEISGIIIPPTLEISKNKIDQGEDIEFSGQSIPNSIVNFYLYSSSNNWQFSITTSKNGYFSYDFKTDNLSEDDYTVYTRTVVGSELSERSIFLNFEINEIAEVEVENLIKGDFNGDSKINLIDLSILIYWINSSEGFSSGLDLNGDKKIDLLDFSIMLYYWTG